MQRRWFLAGLLFAGSFGAWAQAPQTQGQRPKLVLTIVVDQMRYDYLTRYGPEFEGGLKRLLNEGAVFTNANYEAVPTVTAIGHSTILTGATPSMSGIAGNTWYDRGEGKSVQSITDTTVQTLSGRAAPASPRRLMVSTIGDELKLSGEGGKVFGVSLKDRSAILPAGRMADGAFWFDAATGSFVSSTYYFAKLPDWAAAHNAKHPADKYAGQQWMTTKLPAPGPELYAAVDATPYADQMVLEFALDLMRSEQLGKGPLTDLLSVSFSAVDYVGHATGPDTPRMHDMILHVDEVVGRLLDAAEDQAGEGNVIAVFTADHGVAPVPEENALLKLPGGRFSVQAERAAVEAALDEKLGAGDYILAAGEMGLYLDRAGKSPEAAAAMEWTAAEVLRAQPHVYRVYTRTDLVAGTVHGDRIDLRVRNGFHAQRSADVLVIHEPYWLAGTSGTTHGSPFSYDTHVPLIIWGNDELLLPGQYHREAAIHDIAPTLAVLLGIAQPSGSIGRVLEEMLP